MGKKKRLTRKSVIATRNPTQDDTSSRQGLKTWSDLTHDVLLLVMMKLRLVDFAPFNRVCKPWRALALYNKKKFMTTRPSMPPSMPPLLMRISHAYKKKCYCYLEDFEGRKFNKTVLPFSDHMICVGSTCGYLILSSKGREFHNFRLVNPITKHILSFTFIPSSVRGNTPTIKSILVFSPSRSAWVFIILDKISRKIWYSIADKRKWDLVSDDYSILDIHFFKGKIYALNKDSDLFELRLDREPCLTLLDIENEGKPTFACPEFVNSSENLYVMDQSLQYKVEEVDLGEMMWVRPKETYALFISDLNYPLAINQVSWVDPPSQYQKYALFKTPIYMLSTGSMWYFPDWCLKDYLLNEA